MLRTNIKEKPVVFVARFQSGLNQEIWDSVKFIPFEDLDSLFHFCVRIEQQLTRRSTYRGDYPNTSYSRKEFKREGYPSKSKYEGSRKEERERKIEKEET